ncbi:hypothetical protein K8R32_03295 [bacterium]|nr:hypothetical protein [bacterium]
MVNLINKKNKKQPNFKTKSEEELFGSKISEKKNAENKIEEKVDEVEDEVDEIEDKKEKEEEAEVIIIDPEKADIGRYHDPEGLTVKKMGIGLWLVENRKNMLTLLYGFLIIIGVITWSIFIYTFGLYIMKGMNNDELMLSGIVAENIPGHEFALARSAQPLATQVPQIIKLPENKYDILVQIKNPNVHYYAVFEYYFEFEDGELGLSENFILPGETKYLLSLGHDMDRFPSSIRFVFDKLKWKRIDTHIIPDWSRFKFDHLNIDIEDIEFTPAKTSILTEKMALNSLKFTIKNNTAYNYYRPYFTILLFGSSRIIGVNKYLAEKFMSGEERTADVTWPGRLDRVREAVIVPEINITRDDIYIEFDGGFGDPK